MNRTLEKINIKLLASVLLVFLIIMVGAIVPAMAVGDVGNEGGGSTGGSTVGKQKGFSKKRTGYRFTVVDKSGKPVSGSVDILFSEPSGLDATLTSSRAHILNGMSGSLDQYLLWSQITGGSSGITEPTPFMTIGSGSDSDSADAVAHGSEFKTWFMSGNGELLLNEGGGGSSALLSPEGYDGNGLLIDYMIENELALYVEPVLWIGFNKTTGEPCLYGTLGEIVGYIAAGGYSISPEDSEGSPVASSFGKLGYKAMIVGNDWVTDEGTIINGVSDPGRATLSQIMSMINNGDGVSLHIYDTFGEVEAGTHTFDKAMFPNDPEKAPTLASVGVSPSPKNKYKIVKYYEENGNPIEPQNKFIREQNPPKIKVETEVEYKLEDWYISKGTSDGHPTSYDEQKNGDSQKTRDGDSPNLVTMKEEENTLYLLLVKEDPTNPLTPPVQPNPGSIVIMESEITKHVDTHDTTISGWGPKTYTYKCAVPKVGTGSTHRQHDEHYDGEDDNGNPIYVSCSHTSVCTYTLVDVDLLFEVKRLDTPDVKNETDPIAGVDGSFKNVASGNVFPETVSPGNPLDKEYETPKLDFVVWRGEDIPTIASYRTTPSNTAIVSVVKYKDKVSKFKRASNGVQQSSISIDFQSVIIDGIVFSECNITGWYTPQHKDQKNAQINVVAKYEADVYVYVYRGIPTLKSIGDQTKTGYIPTTTQFGSMTSTYSGGHMVQSTSIMEYYPYIRMTYQTNSGPSKSDAYALSEHKSQLKPNDFGEAAWYNGDEGESLNLTSHQWSVHTRAVNGSAAWNGSNQVLPGGAIYNLDTNKNRTFLNVTTWQTIVEGDERSAMQTISGYTSAEAQTAHNDYLDTVIQVIEGLRVVQWVNPSANANKAWDSGGMKIEPNVTLGPLGLGTNKAWTDDKYILAADPVGNSNKASEGDLDVVVKNPTNEYYFKVYSDTSGNVYLAHGTSKTEVEKQCSWRSGSGITVETLFNKSIGYTGVEAQLSGIAKELNKRTLLITNFVKALERNTGSDGTASWASDGKWYNETWDGVMIVKQTTLMEVGFKTPATRSVALDPTLCPAKTSTSDYLTKAFSSQFRTNERSDAPIAAGKPDGYIGTFKGQDITLQRMENMYQSKMFYIPNMNVQDLR